MGSRCEQRNYISLRYLRDPPRGSTSTYVLGHANFAYCGDDRNDDLHVLDNSSIIDCVAKTADKVPRGCFTYKLRLSVFVPALRPRG